MVRSAHRIAAPLLLVALAGATHGQVSSWNNAGGGFYDDAASWSMGVPDTISESAEISLAGAYTVTVRTSPTVGGLSILNPEAVLAINNAQTYAVPGGSVVNDGVIVLNANQGALSNRLDIGGSAPGMLTGSGIVELNLADGNVDFSDARLTIAGAGLHGAGHTIKGKGIVSGVFTNAGLILADRADQELRVSGDVTRSGTGELRATGGGILGIAEGAIIRGGPVSSDTGGRVRFGSSAGTLTNGVTLSGVVETTNTGEMIIAGPVTNNATVTVNVFQSSLSARVRVSASTTISGGGVFDLNVADANVDLGDALLFTDTGVTATNGANHTVSGKGLINGSWVNNGTFLADRAGQELRVSGQLVQPPSGELRAINGGVLGLNAVTVTGGKLTKADAGRVVATGGTSTLDGVTNEGAVGINGGQTLGVAGGGLTNNGTIDINDNSSPFTTTLTIVDDTAIDGVGTIQLNVNDANADFDDARVTTGTDITGTLGAGQVIYGKGRVRGDWIMRGEIRADRPGQDLRVTARLLPGSDGLLNGVNGGFVAIEGATLDGVTFASDGSGGGVYALGTASTVSNIHNTGDAGIRSGGRIDLLSGGLVNDGLFVVNAEQSVFTSVLNAAEDTTIEGTGRIELNVGDGNADFGDAQLRTDGVGPVTATHGPGHTISGKGQMIGNWINEGTITGDRAGQDLRITGTMTQAANGQLRGDDGGFAVLLNAALSGGTLASSNGGAVHFLGNANTIENVQNTGDAGIRDGAEVDILGGFVNDGSLLINTTTGGGIFTTSLNAPADTTITGTGDIVLNIPDTSGDFNDARLFAFDGATLTLGAGQSLTGRGRLVGSIVIEGGIAPGTATSPTTGPVNTIVAGSTGPASILTLAPTATYTAQANAVEVNDRIDATLPVQLGGTIRFEPIDGFVPPRPSRYTVVTSPNLTGRFDTVEYVGTLPADAVIRMFYDADEAVVAITCRSDFAFPVGQLSFADISAFLAAFSAMDPAADIAAPIGQFTFADISSFLQSFAVGCN